ncbi:GYF domain-containing protein [Planctomicrobium sp. SH527]|uniref:GYF domain-containing protein n=1 Tax=Planctomicrobium sp. SH527 TaxID=3448123 RepID=UPI003F5C4868
MNSHYFLKSKGKTLGPFNREQLDSLQARGRLNSEQLISQDRKSWKPVDEFLGEAESHAIATISDDAGEGWYYAEGQRRVGPLALPQLKSQFTTGKLNPDDLVWKDGYRDWVPASSVPELQLFDHQLAVHRQPSVPSSELQRICLRCGTQDPIGGEFCPRCGNRYQVRHLNLGELIEPENRKDRNVAAILALLLGGLGIHHFYLGNTLLGILYVLFCWTFIPAFVSFVEGIVFLCTSPSSFNARYNTRH